VSLSLRDELRVVLGPEQLLLVRIGRSFTPRGLTHRVLDKRTLPCAGAPDGEAPWSGAIETLAAQLPELAKNAASATVVLTNPFMHYAMIPWNGALLDEEEETAYARHFFRQLYGAAAESWELRLSPDRAGMPQLASAVDRGLTDAVRATFDGAGIGLRSIQPSLMVAWNSCRARLRKSSAWFVLFETGSLCLALLQQGRLGRVRTLRAGGDWCESLPWLLEREAYLGDEEAATDEVLLWAPELECTALPAREGWKMRALQPALRRGLAQDYDRRYAVAMSG
jgi:hypothetical protein